MPWKKEKPASGGRGFSERYYQEQIADLMQENRELQKNCEEWKELSEKYYALSKDWERISGKWERNATQAYRQMWVAVFIWPVVWIICKIAELCCR